MDRTRERMIVFLARGYFLRMKKYVATVITTATGSATNKGKYRSHVGPK